MSRFSTVFSARIASIALCLLASPGFAATHEMNGIDNDSARNWGMMGIAQVQAAWGNITEAGHTLWLLDHIDLLHPRPEAIIPAYLPSTPLKSPGWGGYDALGNQYFLASDRPLPPLEQKPLQNLPSNYLDADARHGEVVEFTDECDSHGTRVTMRQYADGYVVIETPR